MRRDDLVAQMETGCKPPERWLIGTEHEKFGFRRRDLTPLPYEGPDGIRRILDEMASRYGWQYIMEGENPIGLTHDGASVTLEPGGQLELSGAPLATIHETYREIDTHLEQLAAICRDLDIAFLGIGAQPKWTFDEIPWMPKGRYVVMRRYLPTKGKLSLDMMARTATVQANLDFSDEADMVLKFRTAMAIQPLVTALFANSPFIDGRPSGFQSYRGEIWRFTDPDRCGRLPFVFESGFGFERYVDYALDVPMFFLYRQGRYEDVNGATFRTFMAGRLPSHPGEKPTMDDWETHLTTLFPDVRMKGFLELRGADSGNSATLCALPALWKGLLYDRQALEATWDLVKGWRDEDHARIHEEAPRLGLKTATPQGETLKELALRVLENARAGLHRHGVTNDSGCDESIYLDPLFLTLEKGRTPADRLLDAYHNQWDKTVDPIFTEERFDTFIAKCS